MFKTCYDDETHITDLKTGGAYYRSSICGVLCVLCDWHLLVSELT